jgi:hypothetical protein
MENKPPNSPHKRQGKDTQKTDAERLYNVLFEKPISRRMAATFIGYNDQTYMVTQLIYDWIKAGKAKVTGKVKCIRSGRTVQGVIANPYYSTLPKPKPKSVTNQLPLFSHGSN